MANYSIDFKKLISISLPRRRRTPIRISWIAALLQPMQDLYAKFLAFKTVTDYELKWNGQVIKLEKLLQDQFGSGIYITSRDPISLTGLYLGDGEDIVSSIGDNSDVDSFIDEDYNFQLFNFTVHVPSSISFVQSEMEAWINKYVAYWANYNIVIE